MEEAAFSNIPAGDFGVFVVGAPSHLGSLTVVAVYLHLAVIFVYYFVNLQKESAETVSGDYAAISL